MLIVDNFDSFTHLLAQSFGGLGAEVVVKRNTASVDELLATRPACIVISPGPGRPEESGSCAALIERVLGPLGRPRGARDAGRGSRLRSGRRPVPVLGVCLGMQLLAILSGARVSLAPRPIHGRATPARHDGIGLFRGLPCPLPVGRYHSSCVEPESLPVELEPLAWSDGVLMALRHRSRPAWGIQFHPESVLTPDGDVLLANFLAVAGVAGFERRASSVRPLRSAPAARREEAADGIGEAP